MASAEASPTKKRKADLKVVIIGDADVGKTCLVHRYLSGEFHEGAPNTIGAAFFLKQWGKYNIAIWDTAGEERFSGLSAFYCRGASAAIVAFDSRDCRTFESIDSRYTALLQTAADNCAIILAETKNDLVNDTNREISRELAAEKVRELNERWRSVSHKSGRTPFFETSALNGQNVKEIFEFVFETVCPDTVDELNKDSTIDLTSTSQRQKKCPC